MNDRAVALLEQYEIEVLRTRKGRGAILCDTQQGCLIFKEYTGREETSFPWRSSNSRSDTPLTFSAYRAISNVFR